MYIIYVNVFDLSAVMWLNIYKSNKNITNCNDNKFIIYNTVQQT